MSCASDNAKDRYSLTTKPIDRLTNAQIRITPIERFGLELYIASQVLCW
jgi:hypothetical protein